MAPPTNRMPESAPAVRTRNLTRQESRSMTDLTALRRGCETPRTGCERRQTWAHCWDQIANKSRSCQFTVVLCDKTNGLAGLPVPPQERGHRLLFAMSSRAFMPPTPQSASPLKAFRHIFDQGVIVTTTKTESSASTTDASRAPRTRRRVLLAIAAVVLAAALAVIIWALTRSSSSAPPVPSVPVDPYVQFCDNSPSLCG